VKASRQNATTAGAKLLEAVKKQFAGDTVREATSGEVKALRSENHELKLVVAEITIANPLLKKSCGSCRMNLSATTPITSRLLSEDSRRTRPPDLLRHPRLTGCDSLGRPSSDCPARFPIEKSARGSRFQAEFQPNYPSSRAPRCRRSVTLRPIRELANIRDVQRKFRGRSNTPKPRRAAASAIRLSVPMLGTAGGGSFRFATSPVELLVRLSGVLPPSV
jgi:hypothetical protein